MDKTDYVMKYVFKFFTYFAIIGQVYIVVLTTLNVLSRYILNNNMNGAIETSQLAMVLISFGAMPIACMYNGHIKVDLIVSNFKPAAQNAMTMFNNIACAAVMLFVGYYSYEKALRVLAQGIRTNSTKILLWPFYMYIAVMLVFSVVCCVYNVIHLAVTGKTVDSETFESLKRGRRLKGGKKEGGDSVDI